MPLRAEHTDAVVEIFSHKTMSTYFAVDLGDANSARAMMRERLAYSGPTEMGHWAFVHDGRVVGIGHLRPSWELPGSLPEIGWYLSPACGGRGLATEAASALLEHGLRDLTLTSV
ncbi:GNAT family N-acetyltransferase [Nocardia sp. NPDC058666]|uniref:GNAT family N-acetyltransferase n=1 Tax=Nocardia sp. NPDC058666 TaxID=3346587 RepID=UPI00365B0C1A